MDDSDDYDEDTSKISLAREQPPPPPPPRRMTRSCALSLIALSAVGFALQSLLVKLLTFLRRVQRQYTGFRCIFESGWRRVSSRVTM